MQTHRIDAIVYFVGNVTVDLMVCPLSDFTLMHCPPRMLNS